MLATFLTAILLCCNAIPVLSDCPKAQQWMNKTISPGGLLVCAKLYADDKCAGFPLPFGINSLSSDLGTASSSLIDFEGNSVTALVRPGCNMYLWEAANFTGNHQISSGYIWNVGRKHYRSAVCNCSIDNTGGLCPVTLKQSYIEDENGTMTKIQITKNLSQLFMEKIAQTFDEDRMTEFLDSNNTDDLTKHIVAIEARSWINYLQRSYICGKYHLFTPETVRKHVLEYHGWLQTGSKHGKWIYNPHSNTYFWFSLQVENRTQAKTKCGELGGHLANIDTTELHRWVEPFLAAGQWVTSDHWWTGLIINEKFPPDSVHETCFYMLKWEDKESSGSFYITETCRHKDRKCVSLSSNKNLGLFEWEMFDCDWVNKYICEKENYF